MDWTFDSNWSELRREQERRSLRIGMSISAAAHVLLPFFLMLLAVPRFLPSQSVVTVDLIAAMPPTTARPTRAPAPAVVKKPAPKKTVLPKDPGAIRKKPVAPAPPKPAPKPEDLTYEDALSKLRDDLGQPVEDPLETVTDEATQAEATPAAVGRGTPLPREEAKWILAAQRRVRTVYVTPPEFLNRGLVTELSVDLSVDGDVLGTPEIIRSSGDPYWDENAVRALVAANPLPAPPEAGRRTFAFPTEDRQ